MYQLLPQCRIRSRLSGKCSNLSLERCLDMARQAAGRYQDRVEMDIADRRDGIGGQPDFCCRGDALLLPLGHRIRRALQRRARLHLDEDQRVTPRRDYVDLAERAFPAPRQDAIAVRDQLCRRAAVGGNAEAEGRLPFGACGRLGRPRRAVTPRHRRHPLRAPTRADRPRGAAGPWRAPLRRPRP